jgi:hypothetical protein
MHFYSIISGIEVVNMPNELIPIWVATLVIFTTMARGKGERRKTRIRGGRSSVNARGLIFDIDDLECNVCEIYITRGRGRPAFAPFALYAGGSLAIS